MPAAFAASSVTTAGASGCAPDLSDRRVEFLLSIDSRVAALDEQKDDACFAGTFR
jgi:hypothetical protein